MRFLSCLGFFLPGKCVFEKAVNVDGTISHKCQDNSHLRLFWSRIFGFVALSCPYSRKMA